MKHVVTITESVLKDIVKSVVNEISDRHFPSSGGHPDIYTSDVKNGNRYKINYGADYGHKSDSSLLKGGVLNRNAKRTEWMWIQDMVNHADDLFSEYHLYDEDAFEAIEMLHELLKKRVSEADAIDQVGDKFYRDNK